MISVLYLLTTGGEVIIDKQFGTKVGRLVLEDFWATYAAPLQDIDELPNVVTHTRYAFVSIRRNDVLFVAVVTQEIPPLLIVELLKMIANVLGGYFKEINEESIREKFSLVYQILEEVIDFGYPLTTEQHVLEELVPPPTLEHKVRTLLDQPKKRGGSDPNQVTWRPQGVKYASNEIFFDFFEYVDCILDVDGGVVRASVRGSIETTCRLSGMPDVSLRLHNNDVFDDVAYHQCVRHHRYETDRVISFVPPDGRFTLFQYRCKPYGTIQPPFYVTPQVSYHGEGGRINIMVGSRHGLPMDSDTKEKETHKLTLTIPLPPNTESVNIGSCTHGSHSFDNKSKKLTWKIGQLPGSATPSLSGQFSYGKSAATSAVQVGQGTGESVSVFWQVPNYAISGIKVDCVNILNESYTPYKGVKYVTKAGTCIIRMS